MPDNCTNVLLDLLNSAYNEDAISNLAMRHFKEVYDNFTPGMQTSEKIRSIVDKANRTGRVCDLLTYTRNENFDAYNKLLNRIEVSCPDCVQATIEVCLVIAAMHRKQAEKLLNGETTVDTELFTPFKDAYTSDFQQWLHHYGEDALDWRPHGVNQPFNLADSRLGSSPNPTISNILAGLITNANEWRSRQGLPLLKAKPPMALSFDDQTRLHEQEIEVSNQPYVLIVDGVSLLHPEIGPRLSCSSFMQPKQGSAVLVVTPTNSTFLHLNRLLIEKVGLWGLSKEYVGSLDPFCEIGVKNWWDVRRWLYMALSFSGQHGRLVHNAWAAILPIVLGVNDVGTSVGSVVAGNLRAE